MAAVAARIILETGSSLNPRKKSKVSAGPSANAPNSTVKAWNMGSTERISFPTSEATRRVLRRVHVNMPWKRMGQFFDWILELRMNVEIGFSGEDMDRANRDDLQCVADALRRRGCGITLHGPFWGIEPGCLDPMIRQVATRRIQQFLDLGHIFQPTQLVCHTGFDPRHHVGHRDFWLEQSHAFWKPMVARAETMQTPLLIENVWEKDPAFHISLLKGIDSPYFGFCLDVGHQHSFSATSLVMWLDALSGYLKEIHLHDNDGSHDHHLPVGEGSIDFRLLFEFLESHGLSPLLTVEPHTEADLIKTLRGLEPLLGQLEGPEPADVVSHVHQNNGELPL
jgi:sugar phosphate isomerase/epimerase